MHASFAFRVMERALAETARNAKLAANAARRATRRASASDKATATAEGVLREAAAERASAATAAKDARKRVTKEVLATATAKATAAAARAASASEAARHAAAAEAAAIQRAMELQAALASAEAAVRTVHSAAGQAQDDAQRAVDERLAAGSGLGVVRREAAERAQKVAAIEAQLHVGSVSAAASAETEAAEALAVVERELVAQEAALAHATMVSAAAARTAQQAAAEARRRAESAHIWDCGVARAIDFEVLQTEGCAERAAAAERAALQSASVLRRESAESHAVRRERAASALAAQRAAEEKQSVRRREAALVRCSLDSTDDKERPGTATPLTATPRVQLTHASPSAPRQPQGSLRSAAGTSRRPISTKRAPWHAIGTTSPISLASYLYGSPATYQVTTDPFAKCRLAVGTEAPSAHLQQEGKQRVLQERRPRSPEHELALVQLRLDFASIRI